MNDRSTLSPAVASGVPCRTAVGRIQTVDKEPMVSRSRSIQVALDITIPPHSVGTTCRKIDTTLKASV